MAVVGARTVLVGFEPGRQWKLARAVDHDGLLQAQTIFPGLEGAFTGVGG